MNTHPVSRRRFLDATTAAGVALCSGAGPNLFAAESDKPAKLGGAPICKEPFPRLAGHRR